MAERRMLTKKVTDDDNFINLSSSAQALYLHLTMSADDDGFTSQITTSMFKAHASVQDMEALLEKRYVYQFEDGVIVIKHWRMANALRKDRYSPTAFQEDLAKLDIKDNGAYTMVAKRLPDGCQVVATGEDRVDKDKLIKDKGVDYQSVINLYNDICISFPRLRSLSEKRKQAIKARLKFYDMDSFKEMFKKAEASDFLKGANNRNWSADFDWMMKDANFAKILDGNYDNKERKGKIVIPMPDYIREQTVQEDKTPPWLQKKEIDI